MNYSDFIRKVNFLYLIKTAIGSAVAILLADWLGLAFSPSAGIITILSIQNTKKETLLIAIKRMIAFFLAFIITYIIFKSFGYTTVAFGGFVFLFVAICTVTGLKEGISMNAVLMTHFLIEKRMDLPLILNEIGLLLIGLGIGIVLNLIMPKYKERIRKEQLALEEEIKLMLHNMANVLRSKKVCLVQGATEESPELFLNMLEASDNSTQDTTMEHNDDKNAVKTDNDYKMSSSRIIGTMETKDTIQLDFRQLDLRLENLLMSAYEDAGNTLLANTRYMVSYLEMRKYQIDVLKDIVIHMNRIPVLLRQTYPIADFMESIARSFHELNNVKGLVKEFEELYQYYQKEELPKNRIEFEYRAILYQILTELEYFLHLKQNFIKELEEKNMKSYWSY
ncbi:hypothetical protein I5677_15385 [Mobilitalea sibirica]|uniref:Putative aromatic acid exporter C-terminal domain-containing protein n=1 Tax=Mobilitalea sibirica TaxID=1462919 RepID=A0A8J7H4D7_9FIRM|nr:aromatic acid exporter family protein [Mobilitalea sibirica]MBH1942283.1 hypothetical protein [Mobilitalea sibirica]